MPDKLIGNEIESAGPKLSQVYTATHSYNGEEWKRSSLMNRSFISFSYGGKFIEDFNLISTISGDRLQKNLYANFEDDVTTYEVIDGQYHWGTHFTNNSFNFILSTDGITEAQLNEFRYWFKPGIERELILAENPNRAIMARVAAAPSYSFIPFEEKVTVNIEGIDYNTSTTLYKGDISLLLVADEPFWYSRNIFIDYYYDISSEDKFNPQNMRHELDINTVDTLEDKDFLKVIIEDNIPHLLMFQAEVILSEGRYAKLTDEENNLSSIVGNEFSTHAARVGVTESPYTGIVGIVYGNRVNITANTSKYLYYSGTAPSKPTVEFTLTPQLNDDGFIKYPLNTYYKENNISYNTFSIGSQTFKFTLPSMWLGYNQALMIVDKVEEGDFSEEVRQNLILGVHEYYSRAWAIRCFDTVNGNNSSISSNFSSSFFTEMKKFLTVDGTSNGDLASGNFVFDSKKGIATGTFIIPNNVMQAMIDELYIDEAYTADIKMLVGDMLRSDFITIVDRNYPDDNNYIKDENCTEITTNYPGGIQNILITFKNMYY